MITRYSRTAEEKDKGFTLIELLVVIIIIGILAAIAIPVFLNQRKKGVDASVKSDLKNAATAAETIATGDPNAIAYGSDATAVRAAFVNAGFKKSPGNEIRVVGNPAQGFCLIGRGDGGTAVPSLNEWFWWDSHNGGLRPGLPSALTASPPGRCSGQFITENGNWKIL